MTLSNSTVSGNTIGNSDGFYNRITGQGGIIYNSGTMALSNSTISNNTITGPSGIIYNYNTGTLTNSTVSNNKITGPSDGIYNPPITGEASGIYNLGTMALSNSTISNNSGIGIATWYSYSDGIGTLSVISKLTNSRISGNSDTGIYNGASQTLTVTNSAVSNNGGGIYNGGTMTLADSTVSKNTGTQYGGGIENDGGLMLTNSTVSSNTVQRGDGGGIFNSGTVTLTDSTVFDNSAIGDGGGIENGNSATQYVSSATNGGTLTLINSTISGNMATGDGGGIFNWRASGEGSTPTSTTLTFCTISGNHASSGAAIDSVEVDQNGKQIPLVEDITVLLHNSLVVGNQNTTGPAIFGPLTSEGYNLLQGITGVTVLDPHHQHGTDIVMAPSADASQYLDPILSKNGGPTETQKLLPVPGNLAIDAIPLAACQITDPTTSQPIMTDQRGMPRPGKNKTRCDIGAYESSG